MDGRAKRKHRMLIDNLPDGAFITLGGDDAWAVRGMHMLRWTPGGYHEARERERGRTVDVLTPPGVLAALASGYRPRWHSSADR